MLSEDSYLGASRIGVTGRITPQRVYNDVGRPLGKLKLESGR
jgi:hypothetical protein